MPDFNALMTAAQQGKEIIPRYTLENMAEDVITLMDMLQIIKAHIIGGSMGGIIAQYVAINFPERVLSLVCLATTSGDPNLPPPKKDVANFFSGIGQNSSQSEESILNNKLQLFKVYNHPDSFDETKIKQQLQASFSRAYNANGFKRQLIAMILAKPRGEKLKKLTMPSLIIHGDYDPVFSLEHGKQLADIIPNSHFEMIEKMGHGLPEFACEHIIASITQYCLHAGSNKNFIK